jgi:uncharacterized membrane protein
LGSRAVRWNADTTIATELGLLASSPSGQSNSQANAISSEGTIVGFSTAYDMAGVYLGARAVRWDAGGTIPTELQRLATDANGLAVSIARDINDSGIIVGSAAVFDNGVFLGETHAVYWNSDGSIVDINTLIEPDSNWVLNDVVSISNNGWIAGSGTFDPDGPSGPIQSYPRYWSLQLPEPHTAALLVIAAATLLQRRHSERSTRRASLF